MWLASLQSERPEPLKSNCALLTRADITSTDDKEIEPCTKKNLLAYDGSPDGHEAIAQAKSLALASRATVHLLAITDLSENMLIVEGMAFVPDNRWHVMRSLPDTGVKRP